MLVAVESKDWIDQKGRKKSKAGFAKVVVANETKEEAQKFVDKEIEKKLHSTLIGALVLFI